MSSPPPPDPPPSTRRDVGEALRGILRDLPERIPVERIERIWLFPPREIGVRESGLLVLALLPGPDRPGELRQVITWRYEAERVRGRLRRTDSVAEEGWAPGAWIPRLIEGVLARLRDESESPFEEEIGGRPERWTAFLASIGALQVDSKGGE